MIEVSGLTRRFGPIEAVRGVSFRARAGEILGVLGPNGAGKTTTLRMLCGFLPPSAGRASIDGIDVVRDPVAARRRIGYLPETNPLYPEMRVVEYLRFRAGIKGVPRARRAAQVDETCERLGLAGVARQTIGTLSKGFRQRVGLADALVARPPVLVLDEPTSGFDPNQVQEVRALVRGLAGQHTILFSSHQLHEVEQVCDRVVIIHRGLVVAEDATARLRTGAGDGMDVALEVAAADAAAARELAGAHGTITATEELADGWVRLVVAAAGDPRVALFEGARERGIVLRELSRRQRSLEEVFQRLTAGAPAREGDRP